MSENFISIDFPALCVAVLASILCALSGNFLILRNQAMTGDALSHVVLPGLVVAFILTGTLAPVAMFSGALIACVLTALAIALLSRIKILEAGAVIGIIFTSMFALGLVLLETKVDSRVHLDAHHVLYGGLELTYWPPPHNWESFPLQIKTLATLLSLTFFFMILFYRHLLVSSFDPVYAQTTGLKPALTGTGLMLAVALALVACFDSVGSILVIALLVCPAATARILTKSLKGQIFCSVIFACVSAIGGYWLAIFLPQTLGFDHALSAGGMVGLTSGLCLIGALGYNILKQR